jgi:urea transporter
MESNSEISELLAKCRSKIQNVVVIRNVVVVLAMDMILKKRQAAKMTLPFILSRYPIPMESTPFRLIPKLAMIIKPRGRTIPQGLCTVRNA